MKRLIYTFSLLLLLLILLPCKAQDISNRFVTDMYGHNKPLIQFFDDDDEIMLLIFWKTCCYNNLGMLDVLMDILEEEEYSDNISIVLVNEDDTRGAVRVKPIAKMRGWPWPIIMDTNQDLFRNYHISYMPQWIAFNRKGETVFRGDVMSGDLDPEIYIEEIVKQIRDNSK